MSKKSEQAKKKSINKLIKILDKENTKNIETKKTPTEIKILPFDQEKYRLLEDFLLNDTYKFIDEIDITDQNFEFKVKKRSEYSDTMTMKSYYENKGFDVDFCYYRSKKHSSVKTDLYWIGVSKNSDFFKKNNDEEKNFDPINEYIKNKKSHKNKNILRKLSEFILLNDLWIPLGYIFIIMTGIGMIIYFSRKTDIPEKNDKSYERYIPDFERRYIPDEILNESWNKTIK